VHHDIIKVLFTNSCTIELSEKTILEFTLKLTLKQLQHVLVQITIIRERTIRTTLARSHTALPDDGDYTETCWSCFNVNFNVNFKIVF
jgi:hypothetical protein